MRRVSTVTNAQEKELVELSGQKGGRLKDGDDKADKKRGSKVCEGREASEGAPPLERVLNKQGSNGCIGWCDPTKSAAQSLNDPYRKRWIVKVLTDNLRIFASCFQVYEAVSTILFSSFCKFSVIELNLSSAEMEGSTILSMTW